MAMLLFETGDYLFPFDLDTTVYLGLGKGGGRGGGTLCLLCYHLTYLLLAIFSSSCSAPSSAIGGPRGLES